MRQTQKLKYNIGGKEGALHFPIGLHAKHAYNNYKNNLCVYTIEERKQQKQKIT